MMLSRNNGLFSLVGSVLGLVLALALLSTTGTEAFSPTQAYRDFGFHQISGIARSAKDSGEDTDLDKPQQMILVLGGSGYIGRRVCKELIESSSGDDENTTTKVVSISRSGMPPSWFLDDESSSWSEKVEWIQHEIGSDDAEEDSLATKITNICEAGTKDGNVVTPWETTIVGCIGNVNPAQSWEQLWGLSFDDDRLLEENGSVYESFFNETESLYTTTTKDATQQQLLVITRCVLLSLDYTCQKCLEGPIEGYIDGKRLAEARFLEAVSATNGGDTTDPSNLERVVVIGLPNFVYGGKRFPGFGATYRKLVESPPAKAYVKGNDALRSLSVAEPEDWVEAVLFSSPVDVETTGRATAMAARGLVTRNLVNEGQPRKQGFFNISGLPVEYDDILFVDGTHEIEKLVGALGGDAVTGTASKTATKKSVKDEPLWEGALVGKKPYLYPITPALFFVYIFWGVFTQQFVQTATAV